MMGRRAAGGPWEKLVCGLTCALMLAFNAPSYFSRKLRVTARLWRM
jgi:hypothetical protein